MLQLTSPTDSWAMRIVDRHLVPTDIRYDLTHDAALQYVVGNCEAGGEFWLADRERGSLLRCAWLNPYVVMPCVMGDGRHIRSMIRDGLAWAWAATEIRTVVVWAQHPGICKIVRTLGARQVAEIPSSHWDGANLRTTWAYSFERG